MVDFQKRDTHRGLEDVKEEEKEEEGKEERTDVSDDSQAGASNQTEADGQDSSGLGVAILTIAADRGLDDDPSGDAITEAVESGGHAVATRELVRHDFDGIQRTVDALTRRTDVDIVVSTGGTGIGPKCVTVEATESLFEKHLPGFGESFRRRLEDEPGSLAIADRTTAGIADGVPVVCLPEGPNRVEVGVEDLLLPEAERIVAVAGATRDESEE